MSPDLQATPPWLDWLDHGHATAAAPVCLGTLMSSTTLPPGLLAPLPHQLVRSFLGAAWVERLLTFAVEHEASFSTSRVGDQSGRIDLDQRRSHRLRDLGVLRPELEDRFRGALALGLDALRLQETQRELQDVELELTAHLHGDFYRPHIDTRTNPEAASFTRVMTGVYYFSATPRKFTGGTLRLFGVLPAEMGGSHVDVEPESDMLLLFPSWVRHEVLPVSCPGGDFGLARFAINCWFRKKVG